ncbi:hypothetical protein ETD83_33020 [Actinomadura soli]|uniref:Uncharacterized protein n=1 Tax=Actinomadura soli TaxID=2508997 RepID=A0A5C4J2H6_9ACTN|nr:hypothetical protein [Actinomadura soli]TMQ90975.1 hypothetical protein ETD83_33020 [Actinomadura soli]
MALGTASDLPPDVLCDLGTTTGLTGPGGTAVLWDLPRTLAPPTGLVAAAHREAFERVIGRPPSTPPDLTLVTDPRIAVRLLTAERMTAARAARILPRFLPELVRCFAEQIERCPPSPPPRRFTHLLDAIAATDGVVQGVVSGALRPITALWLETVGLPHLMSDGIGGYGSDHASPDALCRLACARARDFHGQRSEVILISASPGRLAAGAACGASPVLADPRQPWRLAQTVMTALRTARPGPRPGR